jgi:aquaporin Z
LLAAWTVGAAAPTTVVPSLSLFEAFLVEVGITAALMLSIFIVVRRTQRRLIIAVWVGGTVAVLALIAGPLTGASMNPARTFGPNLLSGLWGTLPFYFTSTALGAWFAVDLDRRLHGSS